MRRHEAAFGTAKLDELIRLKTPDSEHAPGTIHQKLLELPWCDVFTTNYDTLLERTELSGRSYTPVIHSNELASAPQPRILKLHGTFSSSSKLIITEDHFRRYPKEFAPFVNTVQQSLLENSFVLVGFAGDDPNFLAWIGWIRDELGERHAPIYLVSPTEVGHAERILLHRRGVTPIDFSPVLKERVFAEGKYAASLNLFLDCLSAGRPWSPEKWPTFEEQQFGVNDDLISSILHRPFIPPNVPRPTLKDPMNDDTLEKLLERWTFERLNYPGWLIAPEKIRSNLWFYTKLLHGDFLNQLKGKSATDRILSYRELNWRFELSMVPLFENCAALFKEAIDELFDSLLELKFIPPQFEFFTRRNLHLEELVGVWLSIAFSLLRDARESHNSSYWNELKEKVNQIVEKYGQFKDQNFYESAQWAIWNVDKSSAKAILRRWQPSEQKPLAQMWKAGLLAELDEIEDARVLLRNALRVIRSAQQKQGQNHELLSMEGWCAHTLFGVELAIDYSLRAALIKEFDARWRELEKYDCNPWAIRKELDQSLEGPVPEPTNELKVVRGFDPGHVERSFQWSNEGIDPYLPAFSYIRFFEQAAVPMRLLFQNIAGKQLKTACKWIAQFIPFSNAALLIRASKLKDLTDDNVFLSRTQVALMPNELATSIFEWCLRIWDLEVITLKHAGVKRWGGNLSLSCLAEVMSRLSFKINNDAKTSALKRLLDSHSHITYNTQSDLYKCCHAWFERLFEAADAELLIEWLPNLLKSPVPEEGAECLNPMASFPRHRVKECFSLAGNVPEEITTSAEWLTNKAALESGSPKELAIWRLVQLTEMNLLNADQVLKVVEAIWSHTGQNGLPDTSKITWWGLLYLPAPKHIPVISKIKSELLNLSDTAGGAIQSNATGDLLSSSGLKPVSDFIFEAAILSKAVIEVNGDGCGYIEWELDEAKKLYEKLLKWWQFAGEAFTKRFSTFGGPDKTAAASIIGKFLTRIVLPKPIFSDEQEWKDFLDWYQQLRSLDIYTAMVLPYVLIGKPDMESSVLQQILDDINSHDEKIISSAAQAILHWCYLADASMVNTYPTKALEALILRVAFRRKPALQESIEYLTLLLSKKSRIFSTSQIQMLLQSLDSWREATLSGPRIESREFDEEERPELRRALAILAGVLNEFCLANGANQTDSARTLRWQELCLEESLPEIRRAFNEGCKMYESDFGQT